MTRANDNFLRDVRRAALLILCGFAAACSQDSSSGTAPSSSGTGLTAPTPDSPADGTAVSTFRPTLTVRNGASTSGTRLYEFQVSDRSDFSTAAATSTSVRAFTVLTHRADIPEGSGGTTSFTPDVDLQTTTRLYWRSRVVQGSSASAWTTTRNFTTPIAGYSRPGELYDPLVSGTTVGVPVGSTTFIPGEGIRLNDGNSYVRYQLAQTLPLGEFSVEVRGLSPNGPGAKLKVFSMMDGTGDLFRSNYLLNVQYRGVGGNPDNSIAFKALFGDPFFKLEPDLPARTQAIVALNPAQAYLFTATWDRGFRLRVKDGLNGATFYDYSIQLSDVSPLPASYNPSPHFAYLGANNGPYGEEEGSWPGAVYRNVWIGTGTRPASLGSALLPPQP